MNDRVRLVFKDPHCLLPEHSSAHKGLPPPKKFAEKIFDARDGKEHLGGDFARSRIRRILTDFARFAGDKVFVDESGEVVREGGQLYSVTIDVKFPRVVPDARQHRPLEVLHQKGHIVTMLCRADPNRKKEMGIVFKFCPGHSIVSAGDFKRVVNSFNDQFEPAEILAPASKYHPLNEQAAETQAA